jgi:outer membrane protein assembly factor BamB
MLRFRFVITTLLVCHLISAISVSAADWPQWRGPNRDNTSSETGLLKEWPASGPPLEWRVDGLGEGIATVSIANGRIYTLGYFEGGEFLTALDQRTAERVWAKQIGPKVNENALMRWLSQRSPTLDVDLLYAITTGGRLVCLRVQDGQEMWSKNYPVDYAAVRPHWGFCDYPLVDGDRLICTPGGADASLVALDKRTGKEIWRSVVPDGGISAFASLIAIEIGGVRQYVAFLGKALVGVRASDGRPLWRYEKIANGIANSHTPIVRGDLLSTSNGYGKGSALLKLVANGESVEVQEQYFNNLSPDAFQDNCVIIGDHLFMSEMTSALRCINWKSGEKVWASRSGTSGKLAITTAEERLYIRSSDGAVFLAESSAKTFVERGRFTIPDAIRKVGATSPIVAGGRLFIRDDNKLLCYDIRDQPPKQSAAELRLIVLDPPLGTTALATPAQERPLRSVYLPTPQGIVEKMLELAAVKQTDVVFDLGSGDGRIVTTAAKKYGSRAVGYELDKELAILSQKKAQEAGVEKLVTIENKDLFAADLSGADVVAVFLLPQQLEKLLPQLEKMKPGSRLISHQFEIPGGSSDRTVQFTSKEDAQQHSVHLYTLPLSKFLRRIEWPGNHIYHTAFSPDGKLYLGGGDTGAMRVWEVASGKQIVEFPVPIGLFTPDSKQIVGHKYDTAISVFEIASDKEIRKWNVNSAAFSMSISPNGQQIAIGHADNVVRLWNVANGEELRKFEGHTLSATSVFSADGKLLLTASNDKTIRLWDVTSGQLLHTFSDFQSAAPIPGHELDVRAFFLPDGKIAGSIWSQENQLLVWDGSKGEVVRKFDLGADFHKDLAVSPDGRWFMTGHEDRTIRIRDMTTGAEVRRFVMTDVFVPRGLNFSPDGRFIVAGSHRGWVNFWQFGGTSLPPKP